MFKITGIPVARKTILSAAALSLTVAGSAVAQGKMTIGFGGGLGPTDVPSILALKELEASGWETTHIEFDSPDIQTQALINGDIDIAAMGPATVMSANSAGADLRMVTRNNSLDLLVVSKSSIASCEELAGKTVAYHSPGATSTFHLLRYMETNCPDVEPNYIVVSGSANRSAALLNGQIDGTIVRLEDWIAATSDGSGEDTRVLSVIGDDQSNLLAQMIVVSADQLQSKHSEFKVFIDALHEEFSKVYDDPAGYAAKAVQYLPGADVDNVAGVYSALIDAQLFPLQPGIGRSQVEDTLAFYEMAGRIDPGALAPEDVADFSFSSK